jgi:hypothetical protein
MNRQNDVLVLAALMAGCRDFPAIRAWVDYADHTALTEREVATSLRHLAKAGFIEGGSLTPLTLAELAKTRRPGLLVDLAAVLLRK